MKTVTPLFSLALAAAVLAPQLTSAQAQFSTHATVTNSSGHCAWMTYYSKGVFGWSIFGSGWLHPTHSTNASLGKSGLMKIRAEIMQDALCGSSRNRIADLEYVTDVRGDKLFIVRNANRTFQIRR